MSNSYLDINSEYRNRNLWPIPGEFEVQISQNGLKEKGNAIDPVSLAEPIAVWSCNALTTSQPSSFQVTGTIASQDTYGNIGYSQAGDRFTIVFEDPYNNSAQQALDYFTGLVFRNVTTNTFTRILTFRFMGNSQTAPTTYSIALIKVSDILTFSFGDIFIISDDSDLSRSNYPILFVPNGRNQSDAYLNYYLYCENNNEYRQITFYDNVYKYVSSEPWEGISEPTLQQFGNFCIRKEPPLFPTNGENSQKVKSTSTADNITVDITGSCSLSLIKNFYKFDFLRIRPFRSETPILKIFIGGTYNTPSNIGVIRSIALSFDALTYTSSAQNPFPSTYLSSQKGCLSVASDGATFIAAGSNYPNPTNGITTTISKSADGEIWTLMQNPLDPTGPIYDSFASKVIYVPEDTNNTETPIWVAVGYNTDPGPINYIFTQDINNIPWNNNGSVVISNFKLYGITYFLSKFYVCGEFPAVKCATTITTGDNWTSVFLSIRIGYDIENNGLVAIVVGEGLTAPDPSIWIINSTNAVSSPTINPFVGTGGTGEGKGIAWNGSYWVAVGKTFVAGSPVTIAAVIAKSVDNGATWVKSVDHPFTGGIESFATDVVWAGTFWIATGYGEETKAGAAKSFDGLIWTAILSTISTSFLPNLLTNYNSVSVINTYYTDLPGIYGIRSNPLTGDIIDVKSQSRQITEYTRTGNNVNFKVYPPYDLDENLFTTGEYTIEVEQFSYDNAYPFVYTGTLLQQSSCYEFELNQLILPNYTLSSGNGSKIAFYPFVYVELYTVPSSVANNTIYSNSPHATRILFKVAIYDVQDAETTPYVRLVDAGMSLTIKFNPNENLYFKVSLPNGDTFNTILPEFYSPEIPNPNTQISALFRCKRVS